MLFSRLERKLRAYGPRAPQGAMPSPLGRVAERKRGRVRLGKM